MPDVKFEFGKNLDLLQTNSNGGEMEAVDDGGMEVQFDEINECVY